MTALALSGSRFTEAPWAGALRTRRSMGLRRPRTRLRSVLSSAATFLTCTRVVRAAVTHCDRISQVDVATLIAAVVGGVTGLVNTVAIILVNGKVDRLTGRVGVLQDAVMKRWP